MSSIFSEGKTEARQVHVHNTRVSFIHLGQEFDASRMVAMTLIGKIRYDGCVHSIYIYTVNFLPARKYAKKIF